MNIIKKLGLFICVTVVAFSLCACQSKTKNDDNKKTDEKTVKIVIPQSFLSICGHKTNKSIKKLAKEYNDNKEYCQKAYVKGNDIVLESTEDQIKYYIAVNDEVIEESIGVLEEANENYNCEISDDYTSVKLYFDENIDEYTYTKIMTATVNFCGINYILENRTKDWHIDWAVINCHTNKTVVKYKIPDDKKNTFGKTEWDKSYE